MRNRLKIAILLAVDARDGRPFPEQALYASAAVGVGERITRADFDGALRDLETRGLVQGLTSGVTDERTWTLTAAGQHEAARLP